MRPVLSDSDQALEHTLTMLCSFLSLEDLSQFLCSEAFCSLAMKPSPWIMFELGLYRDHTKTLQLIPQHGQIILADGAMTGAFSDHVWTGVPDDGMVQQLQHWIDIVAEGQ